MSNRYKGGIISATPPTTTGGEGGTASGAWTLEQQMQAQAAGLWPVAPPDPNLFIENLFSTWLYTGNGGTQPINNGIDLAGKGGLVWAKARSTSGSHILTSSVLASGNRLSTDTTNQAFFNSDITSFTSSGFLLGNISNFVNTNGTTYASWTFREQPKFFDVLTWTGNGVDGRQIPHNLGSAPGCVIIKRTDATLGWAVYHRSQTTKYGVLNSDVAFNTSQLGGFNMEEVFGNSSTIILPDANNITVARFAPANLSGATYVAYVFAHNAGGFGLSGTDNVISCGLFTTGGDGSYSVTLGYEPQWVMIKNVFGGNWQIYDNMRGMPASNGGAPLFANLSDAEGTAQFNRVNPSATGFFGTNSFGLTAFDDYIYIAIRRGLMKTPTTGTSVFAVSQAIEPQSSALFSAGFSDMTLHSPRVQQSGNGHLWTDRLRGAGLILQSDLPNAEQNQSSFPYTRFDSSAGSYIPALGYFNNSGGGTIPYVMSAFRRANGYFDEVCYTGNGSNPRTLNHNLGVAPELMIVKARNNNDNWSVYCAYMSSPQSSVLFLNATDAQDSGTGRWNNTAPTSTVFSLAGLNSSGVTYVNYLFASCPGVSKVGSYTGTGTTQTINCGFTSGARWVMIKRADSTGDWYYWNSASGIVAGNDPYLTLNTSNSQVTNTDFVDTAATGFEISSTAPAAINANGGTFIFLAIA